MSKNFALETDLVFKTAHFVGDAFISFKYQHYRDRIIELYDYDPTLFKMKGSDLKIKKAPGPSDIIWKNVKITAEARTRKIAISYLILFTFLLLGFGILVGSDRLRAFFLTKLTEASNFATQNKKGINWASLSLSLLTTIITLIVNYILGLFAAGLTTW